MPAIRPHTAKTSEIDAQICLTTTFGYSSESNF